MVFARALLVIGVLAAVAPTIAEAKPPGAVRVRGYVRSNGTYVAPHMRSAPDGNFSNNWTTLGNINPYTGEWGTRTSPPFHAYAYPTSPSTQQARRPVADVRSRRRNGQDLAVDRTDAPKQFEFPAAQFSSNERSLPSLRPTPAVAPETPSWKRYELRASADAAARIKRMGVDIDWTGESLADLLDIEARLNASRRLRMLGVRTDWETSPLAEMLNTEARVEASRRLTAKGVDLPWHTTPLGELIDAEARVESAERLRSIGRIVDWRSYALAELIMLEMSIQTARD